jgi:hypothetical protein
VHDFADLGAGEEELVNPITAFAVFVLATAGLGVVASINVYAATPLFAAAVIDGRIGATILMPTSMVDSVNPPATTVALTLAGKDAAGAVAPASKAAA